MGCDFTLLPQGDRAVSVVFAEEISPQVNAQVLSLCQALDHAAPAGVVGCIPAYRTLLVEYDPLVLTYGQVCSLIRSLVREEKEPSTGRLVRIPVCYGGEFGPDLESVAEYAGLSPQEVVRRHTAVNYRVYMLGFRPGFPYLGGLDPTIAAPRRQTPRQRIDGGSVGIAGEQTGIYPEPSPGGWNIIGRTPLRLFDEKHLSLLHPGDLLRFEAVDADTCKKILEIGVWPL